MIIRYLLSYMTFLVIMMLFSYYIPITNLVKGDFHMKHILLKFKRQNSIIILGLFLLSIIQIGTTLIHSTSLTGLINGSFYIFAKWELIGISSWLVYLIINYMLSIYKTKTVNSQISYLKNQYLQNIEKDPTSLENDNIGENISALVNDCATIESMGFESFYNLISTVFTTVMALVALFSISSIVMITSIILTLILTFVPQILSKKSPEKINKFSKANEKFLGQLSSILNTFPNLLFNGKSHELSNKSMQYNDSLNQSKVELVKYNTALSSVITFISIFSQLTIIIETGYLSVIGIVPVGAIMSTGAIAGNVFNSLTSFNQNLISIKSTRLIFSKFEAIKSEEYKYQLNALENLTLKDIQFYYNESNIVLDNFNLEISSGDKIALIGESGSGKSSILGLITRMNKPTKGNITLNGFPIDSYSTDSFYGNVNYISNNTEIIEDTLYNNLTLYSEYSKEKIVNLLTIYKLEELIPNLFSKVIKGDFSTGQLQRIGIIRAIISKSKFLLMDESLSNVDKKTSELIQKFIMSDPTLTVIYISHHFSKEDEKYFSKIVEIQKSNN